MVILTRRPGEELVFDNFRLTIVSAHGGLVRLSLSNQHTRLAAGGEVLVPGVGNYGIFYADDLSDGTVDLFPRQPDVTEQTIILGGFDVMADVRGENHQTGPSRN